MAQEAGGGCSAEVDGMARLRCQLRERDSLIEALLRERAELAGGADALRRWEATDVYNSVAEELASQRVTDAELEGGIGTPAQHAAVDNSNGLRPAERAGLNQERAGRALVETNARMCVDSPADWYDSLGRDCHIYVQASYCTPDGGYGQLWGALFGNATFEDFRAGNQTAVTACCGCGGGRACQDSPVDWTDKQGHGCATYLDRMWCSGDGGPGPGWPVDWGTFDDQANGGHTAATACCGCGPQATDAAGHGCDYYALNPTHCGCCDDEDFVAQILCAENCSGASGNTLADILAGWPNETRRIIIAPNAVTSAAVLHAQDWHIRFPRLQTVSACGFADNLQGSIPAWMGLLQELQYLDLSGGGLRFSIPPELGQLKDLRVLNLSTNLLYGSLPNTLANLSELQVLCADNNRLTGTMPSGLGKLRRLRHLRLQRNNLEGTLPPGVGDMMALQVLLVGNNLLNGAVPGEVGQLVQLQQLAIENNRLTGTLPTSLGNLESLRGLNVSGNSLTGTLPSELGYLVKLRRLNVGFNGFTGTLPVELGNLTALEHLILSSNRFTGTLPSELGDLAELRVLLLSDNQLVGTMPLELARLAKLQRLQVNGNQLTGVLPGGLQNLTSLQELYAQTNQLTGTLQSELGRLTALQQLWLDGNQLTGTLPSTLGYLRQLQSLSLHSNGFTGTLPDTLGNMTQLQRLYLQSNELSGTLPSTLGQLKNLQHLDLSGNNLAGTLPVALGRMASLKELHVSGNRITGTLPAELRQLMSLLKLDVAGNNLTGTLPSFPRVNVLNVSNNRLTGQVVNAFGPRRRLELDVNERQLQYSTGAAVVFLIKHTHLDLSGNAFNGTLPSLLGHGWLQYLNLSRNQLTGTLPVEWAQLEALRALDASFNSITGTVPAAWAGWKDSEGVTHWMQSLGTLNLAENNLTGTLPPQVLPSMALLSTLDLSGNNFAAIPGPPSGALRKAVLHSNAFVGEALHTDWFSVPTSLELWNNPLMRAVVGPPNDACPWDGAASLQADPYQWQDDSSDDAFQCAKLCPGLQTHYKVDGSLNVSSLCRCKAGREGSGVTCRGCPANTFSDAEDAWGMTRACLPCPALSTTDPWLENATSIRECKCQPGWYMSNHTDAPETNGSTAWTCVPCKQHPFQTTASRGATLQDECLCNGDYFGLRSLLGSCGCVDGSYMDHVHMRCTPCDESAEECTWGVAVERSLQPPRVKAGYWAPAVHPGEEGGFSQNDIWRCVSADTCHENGTCAAGRQGPACSLCEAGKHGGPDGACVPCPASPEQSRRALLWALLIGPCAAVAAHLLLQEGSEEKAAKAAQLLGSLRTSLKQCFKYLQMLGVVATFSVRWPIDARLFFTAVSRITIALPQVAGAACLTGEQTATVEMAFRWLIPVAGLICAGLSPLLVNPLSWCWNRLRGHGLPRMGYWDVVRMSLWGLVLFYSTLLQFGTQILTCARSPNGKFTVLSFPHLVCLGTDEWARLAVLSATFLLVFVFALFVAIFLAWRQAVLALVGTSFKSRGWWGFLFNDFRSGCVHWVMLTMAKDVVLVAVATVGAGAGASQLLATAAVCTLYSYLVLRDQPFREPANTAMEAWTAMSVAVLSVLSAGLGYQSASQTDGAADGGAKTMVAVQWVTVVGPAVIMLYQVVAHAEAVKRRLPRFLRPAGSEERAKWYADFFQAVGLDHDEATPFRSVLLRFDLVDSIMFRNFMSSSTATLGLVKTTAGGINGAARNVMNRVAIKSDSFMSNILTGKARNESQVLQQPPLGEAEPRQAQPPAQDASNEDTNHGAAVCSHHSFGMMAQVHSNATLARELVAL